MPLRSLSRLMLCIIAGIAVADDQGPADELGWMSRARMAELPPALQRPIPPWCSGIYYNPAFARKASSQDTELSARESDIRIDGLATLSGAVEIRQPDRHLSADEARYDQASGDFELTGNIRLRAADMSLDAGHLSGNTANTEVTVSDARYALFQRHSRGSASSLEQQGDNVTIYNGSYTTCAPDSNGWLLSSSRIDLDREKGWGEARHVVLRVEDIPLLYIPWITFPIDDRRKTGLLFPSLSLSDNDGIAFGQPLYLNLHPQVDATVAPRFIENRGNGVDTELRYLGSAGQGTINYGWLSQDRLFNNEDREIVRWQHDGAIDRLMLRSDVYYVSDDFYFKDLDTGLEVAAQTHLPRHLEAEYAGDRWTTLARIQAWQTIDPTLPDTRIPYRRVPQVQVTGAPNIPGPLRFGWMSDYTRFERDVEFPQNDIRGERTHLQPSVTLPLERSWGYARPRMRLYQTNYLLTGEAIPIPDRDPNRQLLGASVDSGLFFERPLSVAGQNGLQTLEPRLFINYVEFAEQNELPDFDSGEITPSWDALFRENRFTGYDRIGDERSATLGLTSRIQRASTGSDLIVLRAGQKFFQKDRQVALRNQTVEELSLEQSPVIADATLRMNNNWYLYAETQWNSETNNREKNSLRVRYHDGDRLFAHAGYQYRPTRDIRQTELAAIAPVHSNWSLIGRWLYDLDGKRSLETISGIEYRDCCWRIRLISQRELSDRTGDTLLEGDTTTMLQIQMIGLGGLGGKVDNLLETSIPGYRRPND